MKILRFDASLAERIGSRPFEVKLASSIALAEGMGEAHAYVLYFEPGVRSARTKPASVSSSSLCPETAGLRARMAAVARSPKADCSFIGRSEIHSKGSETGLTALMVQVRDLALLALLATAPNRMEREQVVSQFSVRECSACGRLPGSELDRACDYRLADDRAHEGRVPGAVAVAIRVVALARC